MTELLDSCFKQVDSIHRYIISARSRNIHFRLFNSMLRLQDTKISAGRLNFFINVCKKLKIDIDRFAALVDQHKTDNMDNMRQVI